MYSRAHLPSMVDFVTLTILSLLPLAANAFWFDPQTGECEDGFVQCPSSGAGRIECKVGKYLQCFSTDRNQEVVFACAYDERTQKELNQLPCKNKTLDDYYYEDVGIEVSEGLHGDFSFDEFIENASPALVVVGCIGAVVLALSMFVCFVAHFKTCSFASKN